MKRSALIIAALLISSRAVVIAEDAVPPGAIAAVSEEIGNLVKLSWDEQRLVVDRDHWEEVVGRKTDEERQQDRIDAMIKLGLPENIIKRTIARRRDRPRGADFLTDIPAGQLFEDLKLAAGATSGGGGGGGEERHWSGHGEGIFASMHINGPRQDFRFMIRESAAPFQELIVEDHHENGLRLMYTSPKQQLVFSNRADGVIHVAHTSHRSTLAFRAANYEEVLVSQPGFADEFASLLNELGIGALLSIHDSRIVQTITKLLHQPSTEARESAVNLVKQLSSKSFQVRERTQKELKEDFATYQTVILEKLTEENLDAEAKFRLKVIVEAADLDWSDAEKFVNQRKLLGDAEYLQAILDEVPAPARRSVQRRINELNEARK